ncbi:Hypothetical predicted protein [Mytilus galloprovincialis]|uniref:Uncharacterized protein n=1 Tax=Mytilus galloprovincialis TaxID=29158 RepID=A0A8B6DLS7_MYTGA|nr:Hypothetical predicted protein [Mytilus galloprovincialis]
MECINNPTLKRLHSGRTVFLKQYPTSLGYAKDGTQYSVLKVVVETRRVAKSLHTRSSGDSEEDQRVFHDFKMLPAPIRNNANLSIVEFADFKASTRLKREKKEKITIAHLKEENEIVSKENFSKQAAVSTMSGKKLINKFLTKQLKYVDS